jgi:hypothetical protein
MGKLDILLFLMGKLAILNVSMGVRYISPIIDADSGDTVEKTNS